jgi:hypothetical protein
MEAAMTRNARSELRRLFAHETDLECKRRVLATLAGFKDQMTVVTGLDSHPAQPGDDDGGGPHSRVMAAWLTGAHALKTEGTGRVAMSMDQVAANQLGDQTQFKSLELGLESVDILGVCDYGYSCAYTSTISWGSPTNPLPMEINPRVVFERLFGDNSSTDARVRLASIRRDGSLLDSVTAEVSALQKSLGQKDRSKVTEYLDAVRDAERRIQRAEKDGRRSDLAVERVDAALERSCGRVRYRREGVSGSLQKTRSGGVSQKCLYSAQLGCRKRAVAEAQDAIL